VKLEEGIRYSFRASGETYGSPRITLDLWEEGWQVSVNTVAEIMAELGLQGRKPPRRRKSLTRQGKRKAAPDLVRRRFDAVAPDLLWYGDMTEIETGEGKIYLATVIDAFSRRCLGCAMGEHHDAALVGASLKTAAVTRGGSLDGTIFHSDRGVSRSLTPCNGPPTVGCACARTSPRPLGVWPVRTSARISSYPTWTAGPYAG
jgi:transposase InsO family protein